MRALILTCSLCSMIACSSNGETPPEAGPGREAATPSQAATPSEAAPGPADQAPTAAPARAEPVGLELPGWTLTDILDFEGERILRFQDGAATVELVRWWGMPELDGGPMEIESRRAVQAAGHELELLRTSIFQGREQQADVLFLKSEGWMARLSCQGCTPEQLDVALAGLDVSW
jgi:hypothetical protein